MHFRWSLKILSAFYVYFWPYHFSIVLNHGLLSELFFTLVFNFNHAPLFFFLVRQGNIKTAKQEQVYYKRNSPYQQGEYQPPQVVGSKKKTKLEVELPPYLASTSAHWFASRNMCTTLLLGMAFNSFLQSDSRGSNERLALLLFISKTMLKASISIMRLLSPRSLAISSPSRRAHSSAMPHFSHSSLFFFVLFYFLFLY